MKSRLLVDSEVLDFLSNLRKSDRDYLVARFKAIRDHPSHCADFRTKGESGRDMDGHVAGRFSITFWDDQTDRHVKIMKVSWADKAP